MAERVSRFDRLVSPKVVSHRSGDSVEAAAKLLARQRQILNDEVRADVVVPSPVGCLTIAGTSSPISDFIDGATDADLVSVSDLRPDDAAIIFVEDIMPFLFPTDLVYMGGRVEGDEVSAELADGSLALAIPQERFEPEVLRSMLSIARTAASAFPEIPVEQGERILGAYWELAAEAVRAGTVLNWYWPRPGRERIFEDWLVENLERLGDFGYDVTLQQRQCRLPKSGRRVDLWCRSRSDASSLLIENKVTPATAAAVKQLDGYLAEARQTLLRNQEVRGLVIADGTRTDFRQEARAAGVDWITLSELGYLDTLDRE